MVGRAQGQSNRELAEALERHFQRGLERLTKDQAEESDPAKPEVRSAVPWSLLDEGEQALYPICCDGERSTKLPLGPLDRFFGAEEYRRIEQMHGDFGMETLAFYKSYRFLDSAPFAGTWGVYYLASGLAWLRTICSPKVAYNLLRWHERYHLKFDLATLAFEVAMGRSLYVRQWRARPSLDQPEEALANREAYQQLESRPPPYVRLSPDELARVYEFMKGQPGAYARFDEPTLDLQSEAAAGLFDGVQSRGAKCDVLAPWIGVVPWYLCCTGVYPEWLVGLAP